MFIRRLSVLVAGAMAVTMLVGCSGQHGSVDSGDSNGSDSISQSKTEASGESSRVFAGKADKSGSTTLDEAVVLEGDYKFEWSVEGNSHSEDVDANFVWSVVNEDDLEITIVSEVVGTGSGSRTVEDISSGKYHVEVSALKGAEWEVKLSRID